MVQCLTSEGTCLLETYSGHIRVTSSGRRGQFSGTFYLKSISYQDHGCWRSSEVLCYHQMFGNKLPTGLVQISWENCLIRCHQFSSVKSFLSGHQMMCRYSIVLCFLYVCHVNPRVYSLKFGSIRVGQQERSLSKEAEESDSGGSFQIDEISRLQGVML